jgi:hypothetical protein
MSKIAAPALLTSILPYHASKLADYFKKEGNDERA